MTGEDEPKVTTHTEPPYLVDVTILFIGFLFLVLGVVVYYSFFRG